LKFDLDAPALNFAADWNKPPTRPMLVAIRSEDGKRILKMMRWGLLLVVISREFHEGDQEGSKWEGTATEGRETYVEPPSAGF